MEKILLLFSVLPTLVIMVVSIWNLRTIQRHVKAFNSNFRHNSSLSDDKYFELKNKQEFLLASAALLFAILGYLGYSSIETFKADFNKQTQADREALTQLTGEANTMVQTMRERVNEFSKKDIINQNIFIVDPLPVDAFSKDMEGRYKGYRFVRFGPLTTISGKGLPTFKSPPSIAIFSSSNSSIKLGEIKADGFYMLSEDENNGKFSIWVSEKPKVNYRPIANAGADQTIQLP